MIIESCLKCRSRSCFHLNYTVARDTWNFISLFSGWLKFWESRTRVSMSSDPISVCNFPLCDLSYWSYFYCFHKDAGWKPSFNTVHNGIPKQRQASWVHTVSVNGSSLFYKCHAGLRPEEMLLYCCFFVCFYRYQQILHRNLVYLATIADSNQNMQSLLPAVSTRSGLGTRVYLH